MGRAILGTLIGLVAIIFFLGNAFHIEFILWMLFGWIGFLRRTTGSITLDWPTISFSLLCLVMFTLGLHAFVRWLVTALRKKDSAIPEDEPTPVFTSDWRWRSTVSIVVLLIAFFAAGISLTGVAHQFIWLAKSERILVASRSERSLSSQSTHNLKGIGNAVERDASEDSQSILVATATPEGELLHGWMTFLLPYVEKMVLFEKIFQKSSWNSAENAPVYKTEVAIYQNPHLWSRTDANEYPPAHYSANVRVIGGIKPRNLGDIPDGAAQTIFAGEIATELKPWGYPANWRDPAVGVNIDGGFGAKWSGKGANFTFLDGSVRFLSEKIDPKVLRALSTPDGGEQINDESLR